MNKTTLFLRVLYHASLSPNRSLSESRVKELLNNPKKSSWHRLIKELTQESKEVPAVLMPTANQNDGEKFYCINHRGWQAFMDAHEEGKFLLECYRQVGHLLDSEFANMVFDLPDMDRRQVNDLSRKFLHLVKVRANQSKIFKKVLDGIIESLISNKQIEITYDGGVRTVRPLTLCQHRDELYLMCYRMKEGGEWENRTYKIARISGMKVLDRGFPYPSKSEWDPIKTYEASSGLILGSPKKVKIKVYGTSRRILSEKEFFNGELANRDADFDTYVCTYTNAQEFLGQVFVYAQDMEILDDDELRDSFIKKAQEGIARNQSPKKKVG